MNCTITCGNNVIITPHTLNDKVKRLMFDVWYGQRPKQDRKSLLVQKYRELKKSIVFLQHLYENYFSNSHYNASLTFY